MRVYKITDEYSETRGNTVWGEGVSHEAPGEGELCSAGWIHCYIDPYIAAFMHRVHVPFENPILWEAEAEPPFKYEGQLKMGCRKLTTIRKIPLPLISIEQRVEVAIRCALAVGSKTDAFTAWANNWLSGADRSSEAARAREAAREVVWAALCAAEDAVWAERSAVWAERSAVWAAQNASRSAAWAATEAVIEAATEAEEKGKELDLLAIINDVMLQERGGDSERV